MSIHTAHYATVAATNTIVGAPNTTYCIETLLHMFDLTSYTEGQNFVLIISYGARLPLFGNT